MLIRRVLTGVLRTVGAGFEATGKLLELNPHIDRLQPSLRNVKVKGKTPIVEGSFVAPSAAILGNVTIGKNSSVWYNAVIRGDFHSIKIGEYVSVGENAMVHVSGMGFKNAPTVIGNRVLIGAGANVHGCTLEDECEIGDMAQVLDGAIVKKHAKVAGGSVVVPGTVVPSRQLWSGVPARYERDLTDAEINKIGIRVGQHAEDAIEHATEWKKSWEEIVQDEADLVDEESRNEYFYQPHSKEEADVAAGTQFGHRLPGVIFNSKLRVDESYDIRINEEDFVKRPDNGAATEQQQK